MNKSEKEHLCQRVGEIVRQKLVKQKLATPDFDRWVVERAKKGGPMTLKPHAEIIAAAAKLDPEDWRGEKKLTLSQVFEVVGTFERLQEAAKADEEFCRRKNAHILAREVALKDRIMLGLVKDGEKCLAEVEGWTL